ncbi:serine/threonine-protein kinase [Nonomuraea sp. NPDC049709]|uniref:serine/threonine-protein kinase n=1 Tax=Nonomuraea sp. NPDC049709 TaxID=3154736 RepID=UPI0034462A26
MMLAGRYRLLSQLGQGGMGTVWRAVDELLRQEVAVKEVRFPPELDQASRTEMTERTLREARAAARLRSHPSIVTVHDVVMDGGRPWIVMELIRGRSLDQIVREKGCLTPHQAAWVGRNVLDALSAAHAMGVLHRDVKPGNVLISDDGRILLTDFGIATLAGDAALTQTGLLNGSPGYIAPERLRGENDGPQADLWSLGATLYSAVEGKPAFTGHNPAAVMAAVLLHDPAPVQRAGPLGPVLTGLLNKDPERRCSARQAAMWFEDMAQGRVPETTRPRVAKPAAPHTRWVVGAAVAVVAGLAAASVVWLQTRPGTGVASSPTAKAATEAAADPAKPTKSSAKGGEPRFGPGLKSCQMLTTAQVRTLLGSAVKDDYRMPTVCRFTGTNGAEVTVSVMGAISMEACLANFDAIKAGMRQQQKDYPGTQLRKRRVVGDETLALTGRTRTGSYMTQVSFRFFNATASVSYTGPRPGYQAVDGAAAYVVAALEASG